jgi:hypothetical protein
MTNRARILIGLLVLAAAAALIAAAAWADLTSVPLDGCVVLTEAGATGAGC